MKNVILTIALVISSSVFAIDKKNSIDVPHTKKIVSIEYGVRDGKTGKASVYVYSKNKSESGFDVKKHRETVYTSNLSLLTNTIEYKNYINSKK